MGPFVQRLHAANPLLCKPSVIGGNYAERQASYHCLHSPDLVIDSWTVSSPCLHSSGWPTSTVSGPALVILEELSESG